MSNVNYTDAPDDVRESLENPIFVNDDLIFITALANNPLTH